MLVSEFKHTVSEICFPNLHLNANASDVSFPAVQCHITQGNWEVTLMGVIPPSSRIVPLVSYGESALYCSLNSAHLGPQNKRWQQSLNTKFQSSRQILHVNRKAILKVQRHFWSDCCFNSWTMTANFAEILVRHYGTNYSYFFVIIDVLFFSDFHGFLCK